MDKKYMKECFVWIVCREIEQQISRFLRKLILRRR